MYLDVLGSLTKVPVRHLLERHLQTLTEDVIYPDIGQLGLFSKPHLSHIYYTYFSTYFHLSQNTKLNIYFEEPTIQIEVQKFEKSKS